MPPPAAWSPWASAQGTPHRPRTSTWCGPSPAGWSPQQTLDDATAAQAADKVYASVDDLAAAWHARLATLTDMPAFQSWQRSNPTFKPRLSGSLWTAQGPRRITVLLDTGATHCFICARLATALGARSSGQPGPTSVSTAAAGGTQGLAAPVLIYLGLGDSLREMMSVSPMDMDVGDDLILGWDWISSHDLHHLYTPGRVSLRSGPALLQLDLLPAISRPATRALSVISHGEFRRLLRRIERESPGPEPVDADAPPALPPQQATPLRGSTGWSRPLHADHAALAATEAAVLLAARARRRPGRPPDPAYPARFADGVERLTDGTVLHLASFCLADAELHLEGSDDPAFAALKARYADVLGGAPPGLPPDRGMELELETGDAPMPRSRPVKRLSEGELAELRAQLIDLLDRGWIQHSTAGHA